MLHLNIQKKKKQRERRNANLNVSVFSLFENFEIYFSHYKKGKKMLELVLVYVKETLHIKKRKLS